MRTILFTGKGGVGKTTITAATGLYCAKLGYKTIVVSTDTAHSLGDSYDIKLNEAPMQIDKNLWAQEINVQVEMEKHWSQLSDYLTIVLTAAGMEDVVAEELAVLPGMEELSSLFYVETFDKENTYDIMLLDCAPTGESLKLITFPDMLGWYLNKLFNLERKTARLVRPIAERYLSAPLPGENVLNAFEELHTRIENIKKILLDENKTSVRLVLNPEKMVLKEAQRAFTYFGLFGFTVDAIYCNRIIPVNGKKSYFSKWEEIQKQYMETIRSDFAPLPIFESKYYQEELFGFDKLNEIGNEMYNGADPSKVLYKDKPIKIEKQENGKYMMSLKLPFSGKNDVNLMQSKDELIIRIGNFKRNMVLPRALIKLSPSQAKFDGSELKIKFE